MIERSVSIHDKFQFEIKLGYKLKKKQKKTSYNIDIFFFIPDNLGISPFTYTKDIFYKDIRSYVRLKTPTLLLRQLADERTTPIIRLKESIEHLLLRRDKKSQQDFEYHIKMVGSIAKSALRDHVVFTGKASPTDKIPLVKEFITQTKKIVASYRELKPVVNVPTTSGKTQAIFRFGDEFLSQNIELYAFHLLSRIDKSVTGELKDLRNQLVELIHAESLYRTTCAYHILPEEGKEENNEVLIYRRGVLKKYIGSVLFLDTQTEAEGKVLEQIFIGMAAGLSMVFATFVAFFAQKKYGNFTFPVFMLLVISYIFKDRIKELTRMYFVKKLNGSRFDHKTSIYSDEKQPIGICKEAVNFVKESELPSKIRTIRKKEHITEIENRWKDEEVIFYKKQVHLYSKQMKSVYKEFNIEGVNDIIRFNISRFLDKMDNPSKKIYTLKGDDVCIINGNRVYHINLIIKITEENKNLYKRIRIILSRNGIERIEEIDVT